MMATPIARPTPRSRVRIWGFMGLAFAAGLATASLAGAPGPKAEVRKGETLCTQVAPPGTAFVTELAQGRNAWMGRLEIAPGAKVPEHRDLTEEYIHVVSGAGTIWIDDVERKVGPGDTIYMPAKAKVRFQNGDASMSAIQVFAGPAPAKKYDAWKGCKR